RHHVAVAHCPESNMKLASGIAPIPSLLEAGVCVGLATDGAASNNDLDMIGELQTAARLHKVSQGDPTILPAPTVLEMATTRAARALGMQDRIGSLEVGKSADLVIVRLDHPHLVPCYNPYSLIAYSLGRGDVDSVMINGRWVMRDQKVLTINEADLMLEIGRFSQRVQAWMATPKA
ncbi:MAG: amidohydrolase family protein, partial [candidate division WOR-3 bacterium]